MTQRSGLGATAKIAAERAARAARYRACPGHVFSLKSSLCSKCQAPRSWVAWEKKRVGEK